MKIKSVNGQSENNDLKKRFENYTHAVGDSNWEAISARIPAGSDEGFLADKFADYTFRPSSNVWGQIEAVLVPESKNRFAAWWWYAAAASLLFLAYFRYQNFNSSVDQSPLVHERIKTENHTGKTDGSLTTKNNPTVSLPDTSNGVSMPLSAKAKDLANVQDSSPEVVDAKANGRIETSAQLADANQKRNGREGIPVSAQSQNLDQLVSANEADGSIDADVAIHPKYSMPAGSNENSGIDYPDKLKLRNPEIRMSITEPDLAEYRDDILLTKPSTDSKKVKSSPFFDGTKTTSSNEISLLAGSQLAFGSSPEQDADYLGVESSVPAFDNSAQTGSTEYSTPVSYGVTGEIKFWNRFSAGTGLGYLQMKNSTTFSTFEYRKNEQHEHRYLSVPVFLKFNFINKPKFAAYTSLGNSYEFLIWQKSTSETYINGQLSSSESIDTGENENQANIYAGLGMHFKFTRHFGIFAEGSIIRYYRLDENNFFNQKDLWPGLKFGALFSF